MSVTPRVSVIVPHYHDLDGLGLCLTALGRQTYSTDCFEIIVADNASPEGEAAVAKTVRGRARLVVVQEKGAGPARNGGAAVASGTILAFTEFSDCLPDPEWLAEGVRALSSYDFVGGRVKVLVDDARRMTGTEAFERVFAFDFKSYINRKGFTGAGNLFCTRAVFDRVGGFGVGISEDVDWSHRARNLGFQLGYAPRAIVGHPARRRWHDLKSKWRRINAETYQLFVARRGGRLRWLLRSCMLPVSAVAHSPRVLTSNELGSIGQRLSALGILYRLRMWRSMDSLRLLMRNQDR